MSWEDNSAKKWQNVSNSNPKPDLRKINAHIKFGENTVRFPHVIIMKQKNKDVWLADNCQNWRNLAINNHVPDLYNINALTKFGENPLIFTEIIV